MIARLSGATIAALAALFIATSLFVPSPAKAGYPCRCGPGPCPDEIKIGETSGGPGVAPVALCVPKQGPAPAVAPRPVKNVYGAIAWHPDVGDVWMSGNYDGPNAAPGDAMAACRAAMGGGCTSIGEWNNSSMTIIRNRYGELFNAWAGDGGRTRKAVLADCNAKQLLPCEVVGTFAASKQSHTPALSTARKLYAAAAWVKGTEGYDSRLYIARGHRALADAEREALAACTKATGVPCGLLSYAGNGFIQTYAIGNGHSATAETSAKRAAQAAGLQCKRQKQACKLQTVYDSRTPGLIVHEFLAGNRL